MVGELVPHLPRHNNVLSGGNDVDGKQMTPQEIRNSLIVALSVRSHIGITDLQSLSEDALVDLVRCTDGLESLMLIMLGSCTVIVDSYAHVAAPESSRHRHS